MSAARRNARALGRLARAGCCLCGSPNPRLLGIWCPTEAVCRQLLLPAGSRQGVGYRICQRCKARPDALPAVEDKILAQVAAQARAAGPALN